MTIQVFKIEQVQLRKIIHKIMELHFHKLTFPDHKLWKQAIL